MSANYGEHVGCHVTPELLDRIGDEVIRRLQRGEPAQGDAGAANRSAVIRDALEDYLARQELAS